MRTASTFVNPLFDAPDQDAEKERAERARRAYKVAKDRKNSWQAYARMLTRNNTLKVELTGGTPCTDGKTIWLRVPIELGDERQHERKVCGERDARTKRMLCVACDVLDGINTTQCHEVSHITSDSFQNFPDADLVGLVKEAIRIEANGKPESSRAKKLVKAFDVQKPTNFVHAANIISPWLGVLLNAVEDARVNEAMRQARPGTAVMFQAQTNKVFEDGIQQADGSVMKWSEQPLNMQAVIGVYCKVSGLDYADWFDAQVVAALSDDEIEDIALAARKAASVGGAFHQSVRFLEALRRLGYLLADDDVEDDPDPDPGEGADGEGGGESDEQEGDPGEGSGGSSGETGDTAPPSPADQPPSGQGGGSPGDDSEDDDSDAKDGDDGEPESGDDDGEGGGADGDDSDGGKGTGTDDSEEEWDGSNPEKVDAGDVQTAPKGNMGTPEEAERGLAIFGRHDDDGSVDSGNSPEDAAEVDRAIDQADYFDAPSVNVGGVIVNTDGKSGRAWDRDASRYGERVSTDPIEIPESILAPALMRLRRVFADNKRGGYERDRKSGRVDGRVLGRRVLSDDYRWFKERREPGKRDYFVLIGLDVSGSTGRPGLLDLIKAAAFAKAELCQRLGVKFAVYAHTGAYDYSKGMSLEMYVIKDPKGRWDTAAKQRLFSLMPSSANLDGHTMEFYRKIVQSQTATDKILLYYTDGAMPMENYDEELEILQREIDLLRKMQVSVVGVGIKNDDPTEHGLDTIRLDTIQDVPKVVAGLEKRLAK